MPAIKIILTIIISFSFLHTSLSQSLNSNDFKLLPRLSFYSSEKNGEFLLHIPPSVIQNPFSAVVTYGKDTLATWSGKSAVKIIRIPFIIPGDTSVYDIKASIIVKNNPAKEYYANTSFKVLPYKSNEVKTDRFTGGLIVNKLPFFPFGFYCYSPVAPTLPEEEVVKGFNTISPYQKITPETFHERRAYMDRCARLGMKVHYNLLSVSGGGGVGSKIEGLGFEAKMERLIAEIAAFRDHPALLGWYIADEPNGYKIPPHELEKLYTIVKENDPWHPVSIVFMAPFLSSKKYENALDIVMADPYPLPDLPVSMIGNVTEQLKDEFSGRRPVWIVPQAFGGGELWSREPTIQEMRSMTWQSIVRGATGIQYFVREGLNYFPKSTATWAECGRMAMEVAELTPWLLSDEETFPVESGMKNILVSSRMHNNQLIVMAVNTINKPTEVTIRIKGNTPARARVLFENRFADISGGAITDHIASFGSQVYLIDLNQEKKENEARTSSAINLLKDSGFEDLSSPGIPSACYARPGGDRGATYFLDTREHHEGNHSLRLVTPEKDKSVSLRFFPVKVKAGASYIISIWAKSDPEQRFIQLPETGNNLRIKLSEPQFVEIMFGGFSHSWFIPGKEWKQYVTFVTIPLDTSAQVKTNLILKMPGQGVAWFDQIRIIEEK